MPRAPISATAFGSPISPAVPLTKPDPIDFATSSPVPIGPPQRSNVGSAELRSGDCGGGETPRGRTVMRSGPLPPQRSNVGSLSIIGNPLAVLLYRSLAAFVEDRSIRRG